MLECMRKRTAAGRVEVQPEEGKSFVKIVFGQAPLRTKLPFSRRDYGLIIDGGGELKPYAVMTQGNKFGEDGRVPWPNLSVLKRKVGAINYFPMEGDEPFTLVFEVSVEASTGKMRIKNSQIVVDW